MKITSAPTSTQRRTILVVSIASGRVANITAIANTVTAMPNWASDLPRSAAIEGISPIGAISLVTKRKADTASATSTTLARAGETGGARGAAAVPASPAAVPETEPGGAVASPGRTRGSPDTGEA